MLCRGIEAGLHTGGQLYVSRNGGVVVDEAAGDVGRDSALPWRSATKAVTAVATARLWEQGLFDLDDRVADYVPAFERADVTIRQILTHTADGKAAYAPRGFDPLGELLHQVDGRSFAEIAAEDVLHPLAIDASFGDDASPSAGLRGPINQLAKLYEALLDGGRGVISPETIAEFTRRHRCGDFDHTFGAVVDMGLGFILDAKHHGKVDVPYGYGPHASEATFGHGGQESCTGFADPAHGLVVAVMFNGMPGEKPHQRRMFEVLAAIYEELGLVLPPVAGRKH